MESYLEVTFRDAVYKVDLDYLRGLHAVRLAHNRQDDYEEVTQLFFKDDKYIERWGSLYIEWEDIRYVAVKVRDIPANYNEEWMIAPKRIVGGKGGATEKRC